jgi:heme exporter protein CcmB
LGNQFVGQIALAPQPLSLIVFAKLVAHWLTTGLPLTLQQQQSAAAAAARTSAP